MSDVESVMTILASPENIQKDFVVRILDKDNSPTLKNKDGTHSTHSMAWGDADGKYLAYPTVVRDGKGLKRLKGREAFRNAVDSGEFIEFASPEEAEWFSKKYKSVWGNNE